MERYPIIRLGLPHRISEATYDWTIGVLRSHKQALFPSGCVGCLLIAHVPSFMKVSVSEVLNRAFTSGVGERMDSGGSQPASACTDIPSLVTMFPVVKKVRSLGCGNSKDI